MKKEADSTKKHVREIFDYYLQRKHCRTSRPKMHLKDMCAECRQTSHHSEIISKIKDQVLSEL